MGQTYLSGVHTEEGRRALAEVVLALFRRWGIDEVDQATLLGMDEVGSLWQGAVLPNDAGVLERAGLLLAIDRALQKQFADRPEIAERWVTQPNIWLQGRPPLKTLLEGVEGIRQVYDRLPHTEENDSPGN